MVRLQVTEEGASPATDVTLYTTDFQKAGATSPAIDVGEVPRFDPSAWKLTYLNQVPVWIR